MGILVAALFAAQDRVEMREFRSFYSIRLPASYSDATAWPAVVEFHDETSTAPKALEAWKGAAKGFFVIAPKSTGERWAAKDAAFLKACLDDLKSKYRVDPLRILASGEGAGADHALEWATANPALVSGCFLRGLKDPKGGGPGSPPILLGESDDESRGRALAWFGKKAPARGTLEIAQDLIRDKRWLDASLVCAELMERPDQARLARFQMSRIEGEGIMALGSVELTMSERRYVDAWTRCREASVQFAWVPAGEKIRKRLAQLETDPRVRAARQLDD